MNESNSLYIVNETPDDGFDPESGLHVGGSILEITSKFYKKRGVEPMHFRDDCQVVDWQECNLLREGVIPICSAIAAAKLWNTEIRCGKETVQAANIENARKNST